MIYVNSRKYALIGSFTIRVIWILSLVPIIYIAISNKEEVEYLWLISDIVIAIALILLIGKSRFLYLILERTNESTITFYNNFFGRRLNVREYAIDEVRVINTFQDDKKYYVTELVLNNGQTILLGRFPVKSQSEPLEKAAIELIREPHSA